MTLRPTTLGELGEFARSNSRLLLIPAVMGAVLCGGLSLLKQRTYTAVAAFMPQASNGNSRLAALAAQFSVAVPSGDASLSPAFYVDLVTSKAFLRTLVDSTPLATTQGSQKESIADALEIPSGSPLPRIERTANELAKHLTAIASAKTGVVTVSVTASNPTVAAALAQAVLDHVTEFNVETRQSQARAEREFAEKQLADARSELTAAENRLQQFTQENQLFRASSRLTLEQDRLARDVSSRQQVYTTILQAYQQARLDEVRDTPVISVIAPPYQPVLPDSRGTVRLVVLGLILGALLGISAAIVRQSLALTPDDPSTPPDVA